MRLTLWMLTTVALSLTSCSSKPNDTEPTIAAHSTQELLNDSTLLAEVDAQCGQWKTSQKSPLTFPAVVISTCNNVDSAKSFKRSQQDIKELRKGFGIDDPTNTSGKSDAHR